MLLATALGGASFLERLGLLDSVVILQPQISKDTGIPVTLSITESADCVKIVR